MADDLMLQEAITSLWFLPLSDHLIISSFCRIITVSSCQQYLVYPYLNLEADRTARVACVTPNTMEIEFTVTTRIVPNKWHDPAVACEPPGCGVISNYENSKYSAWTQSCASNTISG